VEKDSSNTNHRISLFVPGRLCLFGEHSDWAAHHGIHEGFCIVTGTDQGISAKAGQGRHFVVKTRLCDCLGRPNGRTRQVTCLWRPEILLAAAKDETEFFRYCAGVAYEMLTRLNVSGGLDIRITRMDLPLKKGVSSSAAVCILVAKAFDAAYKLRMFPHELMELAYLGERLTGSQCGRMDQACIYGKTPILLRCEKSKEIHVEPIFPGGSIYMFFVDLAGKKNTTRILEQLQINYPKSSDLQRALGEENELIARRAYQAIQDGDAEQLGRLMTEAQQTFDQLVAPHAGDELASPLLHRVLGFDEIGRHIWGGKGVGSQGDGTAQFIARSQSDRDAAMAKIEAAFPPMQCFPLTISRSISEDVLVPV
jgi:galactokinase